MDKKKILAIAAAVIVLCAVVLLVTLAKGGRPDGPAATSAPTPVPTAGTPVPTEAAAPVPTDTLAPTQETTPAPTEGATPEPTEGVIPEPTQEATPEPTPTPKPYLEDWIPEGMTKEEKELMYHFVERVEMDNGGYYEVYRDITPNTYTSDDIYVIGTEEMPEVPTPSSPYTEDKESKAVRCAFSVQVGDDVVMEFWTNGEMYLKGTGRTWDFPEVTPNETEFDHLLHNAARDYFVYNFVGSVYNVTTGETYITDYDIDVYSFDSTQVRLDFRTFLDSMHTIHIGNGITDIDRNVCDEKEKSVPGWCSGLTVLHD